jgi:hypothetical protein
MTKQKKSKKVYFGPEVDLSIAKYNKEDDYMSRSVIYQREIKRPMEKLVENIIHTFKFYYTDNVPLDQVQHEVVSFLVERLHKFDPSKGSKAFSYFGMIAKNYCILKNKKNYKKLVEKEDRDDQPDLDLFFKQYLAYWDNNVSLYYKKEKDQRLAEAFLDLFRKRERIDIFNKKALYIYIREMTNANTQQITKIVKEMKSRWKQMYSDYLELGYIPNGRIYEVRA